jgi:hypothetical protein
VSSALENEKNMPKEDYFLLATRKWYGKLNDFFPVDDPSTTTQSFSKYAEAENAYFSMNYKNCSQSGAEDIKIELIHMRFGIPHIIRNQILFP